MDTRWLHAVGLTVLWLFAAGDSAEAAITYVTQTSQRSTLPDGTTIAPKIWVELTPAVSRMTLSLPAWRLYYQGRTYELREAAFDITAHPTRTTHFGLAVVAGEQGSTYLLLDRHDPDRFLIRQTMLAAYAAEEAVEIIWLEIPPGITDLEDATIHVLKHVQE